MVMPILFQHVYDEADRFDVILLSSPTIGFKFSGWPTGRC